MLSWYQQLDKAVDAAEVVAIARDYLATWTPEEISCLPQECRPGRIRAPADLVELHECAVEAFRSTRDGGAELKALHLLTSFLVHANLRLVHLNAEGPDERGGADTPPGGGPTRLSKQRDL